MQAKITNHRAVPCFQHSAVNKTIFYSNRVWRIRWMLEGAAELVRMNSSELWRGIRSRWISFLFQQHANTYLYHLPQQRSKISVYSSLFQRLLILPHTFHSLASTVLPSHVLNSNHEVPLILYEYRHSRDPRDLLLHHLQRRPPNHRSSRNSGLRPCGSRLRNRCLRHARHPIHTVGTYVQQSICRGSNSERCQRSSDRALGQNRPYPLRQRW